MFRIMIIVVLSSFIFSSCISLWDQKVENKSLSGNNWDSEIQRTDTYSWPEVKYDGEDNQIPYNDPDQCPSWKALDETKKKCIDIDMCKNFKVGCK